MSLRIRAATKADAETIYGFVCDLARYEQALDEVTTNPRVIARQLEQHPAPFECVLAEVDEVAVGFALYFVNYSTWKGSCGLYLEDLFVSPEQRGKGYGVALFEHLARLAVQRGYARFEWAALNWNTPAIEFYESFGARALSDWTTFRLTAEELRAVIDK